MERERGIQRDQSKVLKQMNERQDEDEKGTTGDEDGKKK